MFFNNTVRFFECLASIEADASSSNVTENCQRVWG